jgi:hypothetical protein
VSEVHEPTPAAGGGEPATLRARRFHFPWKSTIAIVVVVLLGLPIYSTLQPAYYERYPQLAGRIEAWSVSTHGKIPCYQCHMDPGVSGFVAFSARAIPGFYEQLIWGPNSQNILQTPHTAACQKCHTDYRQVSPAGDLLIPHRAHVEILKIDCPVCHKNLVHSLNSQGYNTPEMQTCIGLCHNGVKATNQCNKCHTQKAMPPSHLAKNWLAIHPTMTTKINCGQCHAWSPNFCQQCHLSKLPPSHVGNWKQNHQYRARQIGTSGCLFCHGNAFCLKCHDHVPVVKTP